MLKGRCNGECVMTTELSADKSHSEGGRCEMEGIAVDKQAVEVDVATKPCGWQGVYP